MSQDALSEEELIAAAVEVLSSRLPEHWTVAPQPNAEGLAWDLLDRIEPEHQSGPAGRGTAHVQPARRRVADQRARRRLSQRTNQPILLVAPYLSQRTRELLREAKISYVDLTGNVRIALDQPPIYLELHGAQKDPAAVTKPRVGALRGAKIGAIVRALVDVRPPYTGAQIARLARVNEGYASRILEGLEAEGLIDRGRPGPIVDVDWAALLRRRAAAVTLFRPGGTFRYVARSGPRQVLATLGSMSESGPAPVVTGSFAAARLAQVAPSTQLIVYDMKPREIATQLDLQEVDSGADTIVIRPDNDVVFARTIEADGAHYAAPSQTVLDCLSGVGRMPAEGESVLKWMIQSEARWRLPDVKQALAEQGNRT